MQLVKYNQINESSYNEYIKEWEDLKETVIPWASQRHFPDFKMIQNKWNDDTTDKAYDIGFVPSTLYFLIDNENKIVGSIHLRHELNDNLLIEGGHIGYGVKPSERRKGYASIMLELLLDDLRHSKWKKVLITCNSENKGSINAILKNNGVFDKTIEYNGNLVNHYWIYL